MALRAPLKDASSHVSVNTLYSSKNQQLFEKNLCNQSSHYENYGRFLLRIETITCIPTLFMVSKDKWDAKEGIGKSMKSTFYEQQCLKRHLSVKKPSLYPLPLSSYAALGWVSQ